jgi:chromate transport protein ChrA
VPASDGRETAEPTSAQAQPGSAVELLLAFLRLGLTSFGGPIAHHGYFRSEFVDRRGWLDDRGCADLVALCQFLPGPASSQTGIALGWMRAGWRGALAAWAGFTAPSALAMIAFALGIAHYGALASSAAVHGLKIVALLLGLPLAAALTGSPLLSLFDGFYRAGALVFGGGHVVLPLLQAAFVPSGAVSNADFLAGYGAAQAVPGPLFSFAAYLGAVMNGPLSGWAGGLAFLVVIFLPGCLLVVGALPFWDRLRSRDGIRSAMAGINAGVVGILAAALYDPVFTGSNHSLADLGLALACFGLLVYARISPVVVVGFAAAAASVPAP